MIAIRGSSGRQPQPAHLPDRVAHAMELHEVGRPNRLEPPLVAGKHESLRSPSYTKARA